ncbi:hypothetical protein [Planococcus sp. 107-1]|uniref:hypothetical protein n=1 Tax=Planococcus sp. 107-1 TaxID=2908840 RepID=UPI001F1A7604|nr:hypothetical protein [Planococcus sp. 107-1]UJF26524.1 hypothetical protein L0M13_15465 [Planococcus sp. 107-1]
MKKMIIPFAFLLFLGACGNEDPEPADSAQTEVAAPEGELDPTAPEAVDEAEPTEFSALMDGTIEEGDPVSLSGTAEELTDDGAFPAFIMSNGEEEIFVRNIAETTVEAEIPSPSKASLKAMRKKACRLSLHRLSKLPNKKR